MAWTTPKTWQQQLVTVNDLNQQLRDNLSYLMGERPISITHLDGPYTTTSLSFAETLRIDKAINGSRIFVLYTGQLFQDTYPYTVSTRVAVYTTAATWLYSSAVTIGPDTHMSFAIPYTVTGMTPGNVAVAAQMKVDGATGELKYPRLFLLEV